MARAMYKLTALMHVVGFTVGPLGDKHAQVMSETAISHGPLGMEWNGMEWHGMGWNVCVSPRGCSSEYINQKLTF